VTGQKLTRDEDFFRSEAERASDFTMPVNFDSLIQSRMRSRKGRKIRARSTILIEILEACRTPSIEHWIMIKARLGYETFWNHMNRLLGEGKMICSQISNNRGGKSVAYYSITPDGLNMLEKLRENSDEDLKKY
jgi:predicted transcriptional regulator